MSIVSSTSTKFVGELDLAIIRVYYIWIKLS